MAKKDKKKKDTLPDRGKDIVDEVAKAVGRIRESIESHNVLDDLKGLRNEVENLARRVAALERPGSGGTAAKSRSTAAKPRATASRSTAAKPRTTASRSTAAKKPTASRSTASRSTAAKKPAASRSTAAKKPAASRSTAAKKPASSRSRSSS